MKARLGPIVSNASGRLGTTIFRDGPGGSLCSSLHHRPQETTAAQTEARSLMGQATYAWSTMSDITRATWIAAANTLKGAGVQGGRYTAKQLFIGAWLHQAGLPIDLFDYDPPPPTLPMPGMLLPVGESLTGGYSITTLGIDPADDDLMIFRIGEPTPARITRPFARRFRTIWRNGQTRLSTIPARSLYHIAGTTAPSFPITGGIAGDWSIEMLFKCPDSFQGSATRIMRNSTDDFSLWLGFGVNTAFTIYGGSATVATDFDATQWHYVVIEYDSTLGVGRLYIDTALIATASAPAPSSLDGRLLPYSASGVGLPAEGFYCCIRARDAITDATLRSTAYNDGLFRTLEIDADTTDLWLCNEVSGTQTPNSVSGRPYGLREIDTQGASPVAVPILLDGETNLPGEAHQSVICQHLAADNLNEQPEKLDMVTQ